MDIAVSEISGEHREFEAREGVPVDLEALGKMSLEELLYYVLVGDGRRVKAKEM